MSFVAAAPQVVSPEFKLSFRNTLTSIMNVSPSVEFLIKQKGVKTIAYLGRNDDWGRAAAKAVAEKAKELGASVVVEEFFETGSTDFYGILTKVRAAKPDAVVAAAFTEDGVSMIKQYRELRMQPLFLSVAVIWASPTFLAAAGDALNGIYISTFGITGYDTVRMIVEAMKKAGSTDPEKVASTLRTFEYKGLLQSYKFDNANQSLVVINVNEVKNGQVNVISSLVTK
jgi:branched-chain amino acid transport system substrate-binding protein